MDDSRSILVLLRMDSAEDFLKLNNLLSFEVDHFNFGFISEIGSSSNVIPMNRLFIVPNESAENAGFIGRMDEPESRVMLNPGCLYFIPADFHLEFEFREGLALGGAHFSLELLPGLDIFMADRSLSIRKDAEHLGELVWAALKTRGTMANTVLIRGLLMSLASLFVKGNIEEVMGMRILHERYAQVIAWLSKNIRAGISVSEIAAVAGIGAQSLSRSFSRDMGITLKDFISRRLIREIIRRLISCNDSMKEIAADLGFNDEYYFSRFFSKRTGLSPSKYRRIYRHGTESHDFTAISSSIFGRV